MITFESVSKTYRGGTTAVAELDLVLPSDEISILVGPSGCGKTTTLRMINRMIEPTSGTISWDGKPLRTLRRTTLRRQMGYVIQNGGLFPHRTVLDNICTVPTLLGWSRAKSRSRAVELLGLVGLDRSLAHRYPAQLSGGQQQRVGVARALAADPVLLLMDEPFSAVDPVVRADLQELVKGLQRELGKTIVMITHDIDEAMLMGDQVVIMRVGGRIAQVGTPDEILDRPADDFVEGFVGKDRGYRALSFASASGLPVSRVRSVRSAVNAGPGTAAVVVDADGRPQGWADGSRPGVLLPLGATFHPDRDSLRAVVDAALSSPVGLAVAVQPSGRLAGVVSAADALEAVRQRRMQVADEHTPTGEGAVTAPEEEEPPSASGAGTEGSPGDQGEERGPADVPEGAAPTRRAAGSTALSTEQEAGDERPGVAAPDGPGPEGAVPGGGLPPGDGPGGAATATSSQEADEGAPVRSGHDQAAVPTDHPRSVDEAVVPLDEQETTDETAAGGGEDDRRRGDGVPDDATGGVRGDEPPADRRGPDPVADPEPGPGDRPAAPGSSPSTGDVVGPPAADPLGTATHPRGSAAAAAGRGDGPSAVAGDDERGSDARSQERALRQTLGDV